MTRIGNCWLVWARSLMNCAGLSVLTPRRTIRSANCNNPSTTITLTSSCVSLVKTFKNCTIRRTSNLHRSKKATSMGVSRRIKNKGKRNRAPVAAGVSGRRPVSTFDKLCPACRQMGVPHRTPAGDYIMHPGRAARCRIKEDMDGAETIRAWLDDIVGVAHRTDTVSTADDEPGRYDHDRAPDWYYSDGAIAIERANPTE